MTKLVGIPVEVPSYRLRQPHLTWTSRPRTLARLFADRASIGSADGPWYLVKSFHKQSRAAR